MVPSSLHVQEDVHSRRDGGLMRLVLSRLRYVLRQSIPTIVEDMLQYSPPSMLQSTRTGALLMNLLSRQMLGLWF